jgi:hypothetical protein
MQQQQKQANKQKQMLEQNDMECDRASCSFWSSISFCLMPRQQSETKTAFEWLHCVVAY